MYKEFNVEEIKTNLLEKTIYIKATLDLDEKTVTASTVELSEKKTKRIPDIDLAVKGEFILVKFKEWPAVNTEYLLKIQKGIKSVLGDDLPASLKREIVFTSDVMSLVNILSPADFEEIESVSLKWEEVPQNNPAIGSFYLEIAEENAFYNIVHKTVVNEQNHVTLKDIVPGQYYVRVRAQTNGQYGPWSETVTFIIKTEETTGNLEDDGPVFEGEIEIIELPTNGQTPQSFIFSFDCEIDPEDIEIIVSRRDI